jgi:hypothetical protein
MIIEATNCNRSYVEKAKTLASNFESNVIDFKDMPMGAIHFLWSNIVGAVDCTFKIYASNLPDISSFDVDGCLVDCGSFVVHNTNGSRIWIRDRLAFRYAMIRFEKNSVTSGSVDIIAIGKKS